MKILPYTKVDGVPTLRDSDLVRLYLQMADEGRLEWAFYDGSVQSADDFLYFAKSTHLYLFLNSDEEYLGFFWVTDLTPISCKVHFCMLAKAGKQVLKLGRMGLEFLGEHFKVIEGVTPVKNILACKFIQKVGMIPIGVMPDRIYNFYADNTEDALISYYQKQ